MDDTRWEEAFAASQPEIEQLSEKVDLEAGAHLETGIRMIPRGTQAEKNACIALARDALERRRQNEVAARGSRLECLPWL